MTSKCFVPSSFRFSKYANVIMWAPICHSHDVNDCTIRILINMIDYFNQSDTVKGFTLRQNVSHIFPITGGFRYELYLIFDSIETFIEMKKILYV